MNEDRRDTIVEDIKRVALRLGSSALSRSEYYKHGKYNHYQIYDGGNDWTTLCELAGVIPKTRLPVADEVYFLKLTEAVEKLGRYPKTSERKRFGLNFSKRRYPTLRSFIEKALELGRIPNLFKQDKELNRFLSLGIPELAGASRVSTIPGHELIRPIPPIPMSSKRSKWERTGLEGFPYAPQEEQGVLALLAILCSRGDIKWQILDLSANGIDAICYDEYEKREIRVELKCLLSKGSWNHRLDDLDCVVCWENRWRDFPKPVIELSRLIRAGKK
ncbi:MAG: hypothetical protein PHI34_06790 [Acidobacteriota bacterium]|nr:hypothetical protein [Acidobacteriota bacterium]